MQFARLHFEWPYLTSWGSSVCWPVGTRLWWAKCWLFWNSYLKNANMRSAFLSVDAMKFFSNSTTNCYELRKKVDHHNILNIAPCVTRAHSKCTTFCTRFHRSNVPHFFRPVSGDATFIFLAWWWQPWFYANNQGNNFLLCPWYCGLYRPLFDFVVGLPSLLVQSVHSWTWNKLQQKWFFYNAFCFSPLNNI